MSKKLILLIVLGLCALCCLGSLGLWGLFGYLESDDKCTFKGPLSNAPSDSVCAKEDNRLDDGEDGNDDTPRSDLTTYDSTFYSFQHPKDWTIDDSDSSILFLFAKPEGVEFRDNINFIESYSNTLDKFDDETCEAYGEGVATKSGEDAELDFSATLTDSRVKTVNGNSTCVINLSSQINGRTLDQIQYYVIDSNYTSYAYIITISTQSESDVRSDMIDVLESFQTK